MTVQQVTTIQVSFTTGAPVSDQVAALFCSRLLETASDASAPFGDDKAERGRKRRAVIATIDHSADRGTLSWPRWA